MTTAAGTIAPSAAEPQAQVVLAPVSRQGTSVTVAIPTRNRGALIAETIEALLNIDYPRLDILVVDQSTNAMTREAVADAARGDPRVRVHSTDSVGSSAARNLGATLSGADIVAYTDDDCIVTQGWVTAIVEAFRAPQIVAVYGRLLPYEYQGRTGTDVGLKDSRERSEYAGKMPSWYVGHGGNMAFRRQELLAIGGFDPLLGAGGVLRSNEDQDVAYRLLAAGKHIAYSPDALSYHKHWKDWNAQRKMERAYGVGAGAQFFKYVRCRDSYGLWLLLLWIWQLGFRRIGSGLLKWHSRKVIYLGYCQVIYPWIGIWRSIHYSLNLRYCTYVLSSKENAGTVP